MKASRIAAVRNHIVALRLDALLITSLPHVRWLTGFTGSNACCVITPRSKTILTDGRYTTQVREEVKGFSTAIAKGTLFEEIRRRSLLPPKGRIGFSASSVSLEVYQSLKALFPKARFVKTRDIVGSLAAVKDEAEIGLIRAASNVSDEVFRQIVGLLKPGVAELEIAAEIEYRHRKQGAEAEAFEPIVASGIRGCLPHARASRKRIQRGELVTLDFGCRLNGYHSDMTRTVAVGEPGPELRKIYGAVHDAQQRAVDAAKGGMKARDLDAVARTSIRKAGFGRYFTHSLGHGLGLQVHESPRVSALSTDLLQPGHVVTIEPGIYVPGVGGVRIEDDVVIRATGAEVLTSSPKALMILPC
jgi:Xaa-Pro aminopeptidase